MKLKFHPFLPLLLWCPVGFTSCLKTPVERETSGRVEATTILHAQPAIPSKNEGNYYLFLAKLTNNQPVKVACEGTSLTYGQNVPGVMPPINGASQTRALYQYPSTLQSVLGAKHVLANVINRGFPGDRTMEGLYRWQDSTQADVCILEYGTNDAFNFAGYADGIIDTARFHVNLLLLAQRRLNQGSYVILTSPPELNPVNAALDPYKTVINQVSAALKIKVFDVEGIIEGPQDYFDGVHLSALGYQSWGTNIAGMLF